MRLLSIQEFKDAKKWYSVIELSGLQHDWMFYKAKYHGVLQLTGSNYDEYVKLFYMEATKLGRLLHGVENDFTNAK